MWNTQALVIFKQTQTKKTIDAKDEQQAADEECGSPDLEAKLAQYHVLAHHDYALKIETPSKPSNQLTTIANHYCNCSAMP
jgi:hypothetical protein